MFNDKYIVIGSYFFKYTVIKNKNIILDISKKDILKYLCIYLLFLIFTIVFMLYPFSISASDKFGHIKLPFFEHMLRNIFIILLPCIFIFPIIRNIWLLKNNKYYLSTKKSDKHKINTINMDEIDNIKIKNFKSIYALFLIRKQPKHVINILQSKDLEKILNFSQIIANTFNIEIIHENILKE